MVRLSAELSRASDLAALIEETMDHGVMGQNLDLRVIQQLDLLAQTLVDLSRFTQALAPHLDSFAVRPDIARQVMTLRAIADRLDGRISDISDIDGGEVCVF
ncbi:hypothetical protein [Loktanella sp. R86503]|uniref:hypothetical protein n=1 Tax=Loktanella sp. R86503 TaxID=3093847 RepID=UPI0036D849A1